MNCIALYMNVAVGKNSRRVGVRFCLRGFVGFMVGCSYSFSFSLSCVMLDRYVVHLDVIVWVWSFV